MHKRRKDTCRRAGREAGGVGAREVGRQPSKRSQRHRECGIKFSQRLLTWACLSLPSPFPFPPFLCPPPRLPWQDIRRNSIKTRIYFPLTHAKRGFHILRIRRVRRLASQRLAGNCNWLIKGCSLFILSAETRLIYVKHFWIRSKGSQTGATRRGGSGKRDAGQWKVTVQRTKRWSKPQQMTNDAKIHTANGGGGEIGWVAEEVKGKYIKYIRYILRYIYHAAGSGARNVKMRKPKENKYRKQQYNTHCCEIPFSLLVTLTFTITVVWSALRNYDFIMQCIFT